MKVLNPLVRKLTQFVSRNDARKAITGICIRNGKAIATDGHILVDVPLPQDDLSNFGIKPGSDGNGDVILPAAAVERAFSCCPRTGNGKKHSNPLTHLKNLLMRVRDDGQIELTAQDIGSNTVVTTKSIAEIYPQTDQFFADGETAVKFSLDADLLNKICALATGPYPRKITFEIKKNDLEKRNTPVVIFKTRHGVRGVIMPLRSYEEEE